MYNLVSCYDSMELRDRGDITSDKVYLSEGDTDQEEVTFKEGVKMSQSDSILTDMTHVLSPCLDLRSPLHSISSPRLPEGGVINCNGNGILNQNQGGGKGRHVTYRVEEGVEGPWKGSEGSWNSSSRLKKNHQAKPISEKEPEPYCFPCFRWSLIMVGLGMLVIVLVVMVQLLVDWGRGTA